MNEKALRTQVWDVRDGMYCICIGAGCGDYMLTAIRRGAARVYAFEPFLPAYIVLKKNLILNKWQDFAVLSSLALSSKERDAFIHAQTHNVVDEKTDFPIHLSTLDSFMEALSITPPRLDWIQIDAELEEIKIAEGMAKTVRRYKPKILVEIHSPNTIKQFLNTLDAGYVAESLINHVDAGDNSHWLCKPH